MRRFFSFYAYLIALYSFCIILFHQEVTAEKDRRTNFCAQHQKVERNEVLLQDALRGLNITAAIYSLPKDPNPMAIRIMDELAWRAQFEWRNSYGIEPLPSENETYTDILLRNSKSYDIVVDWWARTIERLNLGIIFPESWYEADTIIVRKKPKVENVVNPWAFTLPFTPGLWGLIGITAVVSGLVQYFLDYLNHRSGQNQLDKTFTGCIFFSFHAFTGHCNYTPKSQASRILTISMCFLSLILIASFTANLANFFIRKNTSALAINDINDVVYKNLLVCSQRAIVLTENFKAEYPKANLREFETEEEMFVATSEGECAVCLTTTESFKTYKRDMKYNVYCDLEWVGRRVESTPASLALSNSEEFCTSLLHNALDLHLLQMKKDGTIERLWDNYRDAVSPNTCTTEVVEEENDDDGRLTILSMSGAFGFHLILIIVSLCFGAYEYYHQPTEVKQKIKKDIKTGKLFSGVSIRRPSLYVEPEKSSRTFASQFSLRLSAISATFGTPRSEDTLETSKEFPRSYRVYEVQNSQRRNNSNNETFNEESEQKCEIPEGESLEILERTMHQKISLIEEFEGELRDTKEKMMRKKEIIEVFEEDVREIEDKLATLHKIYPSYDDKA